MKWWSFLIGCFENEKVTRFREGTIVYGCWIDYKITKRRIAKIRIYPPNVCLCLTAVGKASDYHKQLQKKLHQIHTTWQKYNMNISTMKVETIVNCDWVLRHKTSGGKLEENIWQHVNKANGYSSRHQ